MESDYGFYDNAFSEKSVRQAFIRKVYSILSIQLLLTIGVAVLFTTVDTFNTFAKENVGILAFVPLIGCMVTVIPLACSQDLRRRVPHNFILLGIFTLSESLAIGAIVAWSPGIALQAFIITAAIVFGLTLFAFQTKIDFTVANGFMFCVLLVFTVVGFMLMFFPTNSKMHTIYAGLGVLIFSVYLIIDTQMLVSDKHKFQISSEDYIFGALTIYLDIIQIFIYILSILGNSDK